MKIVAEGRRPLEYFHDRWNLLDCFIAVVSVVSLISGSAGKGTQTVIGLRVVRLLRVLKLMRIVPKMRILVMALVASLASIAYIGLLLVLLFYFYGIIGAPYARTAPLHPPRCQGNADRGYPGQARPRSGPTTRATSGRSTSPSSPSSAWRRWRTGPTPCTSRYAPTHAAGPLALSTHSLHRARSDPRLRPLRLRGADGRVHPAAGVARLLRPLLPLLRRRQRLHDPQHVRAREAPLRHCLHAALTHRCAAALHSTGLSG